MKKRALAILFFVFLFSSTVFAQTVGPGSDIDLSVSIEHPSPGRSVTITARSFTINIKTSRVTWTVNGTVLQSGIGLTSADVVAPALGKKNTVVVTAVTPEGLTVRGSISIGSGSIDLITETNGHVPLFFRGKLTPVYQNSVRIIAIPHLANPQGVEYDPKTLIYKWEKNNRVIEDQSGYGNQALNLVGDIVPRPYDVTVTATSRDGNVQAENKITIAAAEASIGFYISDPLYGPLLNKGLQDIIQIGAQKETTILAVPFGFNKPVEGMGSLSWSWLINSVRRPNLSTNESVVLRAPEKSTGSSNIELEIRNTDRILQGASAKFSAQFDGRVSTDNEVTFQ